jgi:hypothetical protein
MNQPDNFSVASFCPQCGKQVRSGAKFCAACGTKLAGHIPSPTPAAPAKYTPPAAPPSHKQASPPAAYTPPSYSPPQLANPGAYTPPTNQPPLPPTKLYSQTPPAPFGQSPRPTPAGVQPARVNLSEAFNFPFRGSSNGLMNMLIGGIAIVIPVIGWLVISGYMIEVVRRVINDDHDQLPDWGDLGARMKDGLYITILNVIWGLVPVTLLALPGILITQAGEFDLGISLTMIGYGLGFLVTYFFLPVVWGRYASENRLMAGLEVGQIWAPIRENFGRYAGNWLLAGLMLFFGVTVITVMASISGALMVFLVGICALPFVFMASFYTGLIQAHLMGQLYRLIAQP